LDHWDLLHNRALRTCALGEMYPLYNAMMAGKVCPEGSCPGVDHPVGECSHSEVYCSGVPAMSGSGTGNVKAEMILLVLNNM